jgi:hypothetical protein
VPEPLSPECWGSTACKRSLGCCVMLCDQPGCICVACHACQACHACIMSCYACLLCMLYASRCIQMHPFDTREHFKSIRACRFAILGQVDDDIIGCCKSFYKNTSLGDHPSKHPWFHHGLTMWGSSDLIWAREPLLAATSALATRWRHVPHVMHGWSPRGFQHAESEMKNSTKQYLTEVILVYLLIFTDVTVT